MFVRRTSLGTPDTVENTWRRFAQDRTPFLPLPGGDGRGESERWCHRLSSPILADGAVYLG